MVMLPQVLNGIAIPAAASLLGSPATKTEENSSKKNAFSSVLKSELNNQTNNASSVNATKKLEERLKALAAEINKAAEPAAQQAKDSVAASILGAMTAGNVISPVSQSNTLKTDVSQTQKLAATSTTPSAQMPEANGQTKLIGENPSLVLISQKDPINKAGFDRYRMDSLATTMNKKGLSGNNLMVGLRIPIG
jgi:hypothetical protein